MELKVREKRYRISSRGFGLEEYAATRFCRAKVRQDRSDRRACHDWAGDIAEHEYPFVREQPPGRARRPPAAEPTSVVGRTRLDRGARSHSTPAVSPDCFVPRFGPHSAKPVIELVKHLRFVYGLILGAIILHVNVLTAFIRLNDFEQINVIGGV